MLFLNNLRTLGNDIVRPVFRLRNDFADIIRGEVGSEDVFGFIGNLLLIEPFFDLSAAGTGGGSVNLNHFFIKYTLEIHHGKRVFLPFFIGAPIIGRMEKKVIAIDLDGTLLKNDETLTPFSASILSALEKQGHVVLLTSGRPPRAILPLWEQAGLHSPIISYNGALVFHPGDPSFSRFEAKFPLSKIQSLIQECRPHCFCMMSETSSCIYEEGNTKDLHKYFWRDGMGIHPLSELKEDPFTLIFGECPEEDEYVENVANKYSLSWRHWRNMPYSELYFPEASKGEGLKKILGILGVSKGDVYAFGDSDNDLSLLLEAGHPCCMKDAKSHLLKEKFPLTKKGHDEDGVALELQQIFSL